MFCKIFYHNGKNFSGHNVLYGFLCFSRKFRKNIETYLWSSTSADEFLLMRNSFRMLDIICVLGNNWHLTFSSFWTVNTYFMYIITQNVFLYKDNPKRATTLTCFQHISSKVTGESKWHTPAQRSYRIYRNSIFIIRETECDREYWEFFRAYNIPIIRTCRCLRLIDCLYAVMGTKRKFLFTCSEWIFANIVSLHILLVTERISTE